MLIPKEVFPISKLAARDSTRYAINGVKVERHPDGACRAIVTDGRRLIVAEWNDAESRKGYPPGAGDTSPKDGFQTLISREQWEKVSKLIPNARQRPVLQSAVLDEHASSDQSVVMGITDGASAITNKEPPIEGVFPRYEDLELDPPRGSHYFFVNPTLMAEYLTTLSKVVDPRDMGVAIVAPKDRGRAIRIESRTADMSVYGLLMPLSGDDMKRFDLPAIEVRLHESADDLLLNARRAPAPPDSDDLNDETLKTFLGEYAVWYAARTGILDAIVEPVEEATPDGEIPPSDDAIEHRWLQILKLAADAPNELRSVDLDRVVSEAENQGVRDEFVEWLARQDVNSRTRQAIEDLLAGDANPEPVEAPVAPIESTDNPANAPSSVASDPIIEHEEPATEPDRPTASPSVTAPMSMVQKHVTVASLRKSTCARCTSCQVAVHNGRFKTSDKWLIRENRYYCPACADFANDSFKAAS